MNIFSEKLFAAMVRNGISQSTAARLSGHLAELWGTDRQLTAEDLKDIERIASSMSDVILRQHTETRPDNFPEQIQPAIVKKKREGMPNSKFFTWLAKSSKGVRVSLSYIIPALLILAAVVTVIASAVLIAALILMTVAATAAGILLFITGLLYGISQLHVFYGAGLYEIGLGLVLGSLSAAATVLLYNAVIKGIPFCAKFALRHISSALSNFRRFRLATEGRRR